MRATILKTPFKYLFLATVVTFFTACDAVLPKDQNEKFNQLTQTFLVEYYQFFPDDTPLSIDNENLSKIAIPTTGYLDSLRQFHQRTTAEMQQFDTDNLSPALGRDRVKMEKILKNIGVYLADYPRNPQRFNVLHGFRRILAADYASDEYRLQTLFNKLALVPTYYEAAKSQLTDVSLPAADAAVEQHVLTYDFFEKTLEEMLKSRRQMTPQYQARLLAAKLAIKDYAAFVESFKVK
jgi:hypothetical protein